MDLYCTGFKIQLEWSLKLEIYCQKGYGLYISLRGSVVSRHWLSQHSSDNAFSVYRVTQTVLISNIKYVAQQTGFFRRDNSCKFHLQNAVCASKPNISLH